MEVDTAKFLCINGYKNPIIIDRGIGMFFCLKSSPFFYVSW